jgi:hypothetical protein
MKNQTEYCDFVITNTGGPAKSNPLYDNDIYRLSALVDGIGWDAQLMNSLVSVRQGGTEKIQVFVSHDKSCSGSAKVILTARSENDSSKFVTSSFIIKK